MIAPGGRRRGLGANPSHLSGQCLVLIGATMLLVTGHAYGQPEPVPPAPATSPDADVAERVAIIELRHAADDGARTRQAASRAQLRAAIASDAALVAAAATDATLGLALAGELPTALDGAHQTARARLDQAASAFGKLDCAATDNAARQAVLALTGLRAAGRPVTDDLQRAYVYRFLCAHNQGDSDAAMRARAHLDQLGVTQAPTGVSALVWNLYPPLDATANSNMVELTVTSEPSGAAVWVDHVRHGTTPARVVMPVGAHLVGVALGARYQVLEISAQRDGQTVAATLPAVRPESPHRALSQNIATWRRKRIQPSGVDIGSTMAEQAVRFALVLSDRQARTQGPAAVAGPPLIEIWSLAPGATKAEMFAVRPATPVDAVVAAVRDRANKWDATGPNPDIPLLREGQTSPTGKSDRSKSPRWWVYATVIGAAAVGATFLVANELADDRQRIEMTWP